jgi:uncharacterized protein YbcI
MDESRSTVVQQVSRVAIAFEQQRTGHAPESVAVVLGGDTLVVTLRVALSPAERALARSPGGAAQLQEFHRQLFAGSLDSLRQQIRRITGVEVREATADRLEPFQAETGGEQAHARFHTSRGRCWATPLPVG